MSSSTKTKWLLLIHQIPPKPNYFRVKIWRRLKQIGAIAVKQSVYVLPQSEQSYEDLSWIVKEIIEGGGGASLSEVRFLEGLSKEQIELMFQTARSADYAKIVEEARSLTNELTENLFDTTESASKIKAQFFRLQKRFEAVVAIDFFSAPERGAAEIVISEIASQLKGAPATDFGTARTIKNLKGKTWVTRKNVYVDRIASAWLIKRFIDKEAEFKFVASKKYKPKPEELRFDMFEAEYTHEGDRCTFEVMIDRFGLDSKGLIPIAEIIHDIDLKDDKYGRQEAAGLTILFSGLFMAHSTDEKRIIRGATILDDMFEYFQRQKVNRLTLNINNS